jgi:hypothetical protein
MSVQAIERHVKARVCWCGSTVELQVQSHNKIRVACPRKKEESLDYHFPDGPWRSHVEAAWDAWMELDFESGYATWNAANILRS